MCAFELIRFDGPENLAQAVAADWLKNLRQSAGRAAPYCVALLGGRIAGRLYSAVAGLAKTAEVLNSVHFFWSDERCVPPDSPESNFGLARERLFQPLAIPERQIHRLRGEVPPELAVAEAETELRSLASVFPDGQPVMDLVFLGMGEDGHVASLFPGETEAVMASQVVFRPVVAAKPPPHRMTLGFPAIAAAREVWVLASGPGKAGALRESFAPNGRTPLARVLNLRHQTRIFTDIFSVPT
jgi:6-phosphogluconolactonase